MKSRTTIVTGADGYVGCLLLRKYLLERQPVVAWVHASGEKELAAKKNSLLQRLTCLGVALPDAGALKVVGGSLEDDSPFDSLRDLPVDTFIHSAAVTRFNVDADTARRTNLEGTKKALQFAENCSDLNRFLFISTLYASGLLSGELREEAIHISERQFANHYERSKWASEMELLNNFQHLPWQIARVATIIADSPAGNVSQQNAFHNTLKLVYYGLLSVLPGVPATPLYLVCGEFVTEALFAIACAGDPQKIYHIAHTRKESANLGELLDLAFNIFERDSSFSRRRVLRPLYADFDSFNVLASTMSSLAPGIMSQALSSVSPFARQLFIDKDIRNENLVSLLPGYEAAHAREFISNTCQHLVDTRWGRINELAKR